MYNAADKTQLIADLTWAGEVQDTRAISRLADHGLDLGIIDAATHSKFIVLGKVIRDLKRKDGEWYGELVVKLAQAL